MNNATTTSVNLLFAAVNSGGGTISTDDCSSPSAGFCVARPEAELITAKLPHRAVVEAWLRHTVSDDAAFVGVWVDSASGKVYFDEVRIVEDRDEAIKLGREWGQLAIFDLNEGEEIRL